MHEVSKDRSMEGTKVVTPLTMEEGHQVVHHLTMAEVEAVDTTHRDTSLNTSLGEYLSPFHSLFYITFILLCFSLLFYKS